MWGWGVDLIVTSVQPGKQTTTNRGDLIQRNFHKNVGRACRAERQDEVTPRLVTVEGCYCVRNVWCNQEATITDYRVTGAAGASVALE